MNRFCLVVAALLVPCGVACGPVNYDGQEDAEDEACLDNTAGGEDGSPDELSELLAELIAPRICDQATGAFIGLPGEDSREGMAAGLDPSVGRWWIRRCNAEVVQNRLQVAIGGPGWTWLDRESTGFRVRQYLRFEGEATFSASLHVGYDPATRLASIWLRPAPGVRATIEPTGLVRAEATGVFSSMLGGILDLTGSSASDRARQQATDEGSQRLSERLQTGFTVTFQIDSEQMDFMLGQLQRGQTPQRPWPASSAAWLVNERSSVWPGGLDVLGPLPTDAGDMTVELELEEGDGASVRRVCDETLHRWLDAAWSGQEQGPPDGTEIASMTATHQPRSVLIPATACRSLLVVTPSAETTTPVSLRYRVTTQDAVDAAAERVAAAGAIHGGPTVPVVTPPPAVRPGAVRIQIRSVSVQAENASGGNWDMFGGDPDPYTVVTSIARGREIDRTEAIDDNREARFDHWLPAAVRAEDFPIRFVVYDEDVAGDEVVGTADIEASAMPGQDSEMTLDLRSQGNTPRRTGVLRIRLQPVH